MAALVAMLAVLVLGALLAWSIPAGARAGTTHLARAAHPAIGAGPVVGSSTSPGALPSLSIGAATLPPQSATSTPTPTATPTASASPTSTAAATTGGGGGGGRDAIETDLILIMVGSGVVVLLSILGLWITRDVRRRRLRAH